MRLRSSSILIITCLTCLGCDPSSAGATTHSLTSEIKIASVSSKDTFQQSILRPGSTGGEVKVLQSKLKELGYYDGLIDGQYGSNTSLAVSKFQKTKGLIADGVFGTTTQEILEPTVKKKLLLSSATSTTTNKSAKQEGEPRGLVWWSLVGIGVLGIVGALLYLVKWYGEVKKFPSLGISDYKTYHQNHTNQVKPSSKELDPTLDTTTDEISNSSAFISPREATSPPTELFSSDTTTHLAKVNIVDELINDLDHPDPIQRRKAIWDLGQQGDSRAIQPLVELMTHTDSQQRSLILAALTEIGARTLKPMNHALAVSLQDESPQVRQNAIRDLTRVYDSMAQISQMLSHAVQDPDAEVQATARYALSQMNRIRALPPQEIDEKKAKGENHQPENL